MKKIRRGVATLLLKLIGARKRYVMDYLIRAEKFAQANGDENWFKLHYTRYREYNNVADSVWKTLSYLYDDNTANRLEFQ